MMKNECNKQMNFDKTSIAFQCKEIKGMKNKCRQNLGYGPNYEKLRKQIIKLRQDLEGVPMITTQRKDWMTLDTYNVIPKIRKQREKE